MTKQVEIARSLRKRLTPQEVKVWVKLRELKPLGFHFRRQVPIDSFIVDFACLRHALVVEIDGGQHGMDKGVADDAERDAVLHAKGLRVLRFWNSDVDRNLNGVLETIVSSIVPHPARESAPPSPNGGGKAAAADPSLLGEGGGPKGRRVGSEQA